MARAIRIAYAPCAAWPPSTTTDISQDHEFAQFLRTIGRGPQLSQPLDPERVAALWRGETELPAPEAAVTGTVELALSAIGRAEDRTEAQAMAEAMWRARPHKNP